MNESEIAFQANRESVVAAILFQADKEVVKHLRKGQRNHDERNPRGPQRDPACEKTDDSAGGHGDQQLQPSVIDLIVGQKPDAVGTQAKVEGMTKAHQATKAQNDIQAECGKCKDEHPR